MGSKAGQQPETAAQKAATDHAVQQLQDYKARWLPVQERLASTIEAAGAKDSAARRLAAGKSSTDTAMQFGRAEGALEKALTNNGVAPGSPRADLGTVGIGTDAAGATGMGHMISDQAIDDAYTKGLGALTSIGRGQSAQVGNSLSTQAATSAATAAADARASLAEHVGYGQLVGQVGGFGLQQGLGGGGETAGNVQGIVGQYNTSDPFGRFRSATGMSATSVPTAGGM